MTIGDDVLIAILCVGVGAIIYNRGQRFGELKERVDAIWHRLDKMEAKQDSQDSVISETKSTLARLETDNSNSKERVRRIEDLQGRLSDDVGTIKQALVQAFTVREAPKPEKTTGGRLGGINKGTTAVDAIRVKESGKTLRTVAKIGFRALVVAGLLGLTFAGIPIPHSAHLWALS